MPVQWIAFLASVLAAYIGISIFAQLSSGATTPLSAFFSTLRPLPFFVVTIANMFFGLGIYYGFGLTRFAIPIAISVGVLIPSLINPLALPLYPVVTQ